MLTGVIYSNKAIDNPSQYLNAVFGSYWTSMDRVDPSLGCRSIRFTARNEVRRLCEVSRNIDIVQEGSRWDDRPLTYREDEEALLSDEVPF